MNIYAYLEPILKNLIVEISKSVKKFTKSWKMKNFLTWDFLFLTLEPSILAFSKKTLLLPKPWTGKFKAKNSNFCVCKVSIWRHLIIITFSGLHFLFSVNPWILNRGLPNPHRKINGHFAPVCGLLLVTLQYLNIYSRLAISHDIWWSPQRCPWGRQENL